MQSMPPQVYVLVRFTSTDTLESYVYGPLVALEVQGEFGPIFVRKLLKERTDRDVTPLQNHPPIRRLGHCAIADPGGVQLLAVSEPPDGRRPRASERDCREPAEPSGGSEFGDRGCVEGSGPVRPHGAGTRWRRERGRPGSCVGPVVEAGGVPRGFWPHGILPDPPGIHP